MQTSIFLAKLIGPVFVLMGIAVILDSKRFQELEREFIESEALIFLSGIITLPIGLAIVNTHNVWVFDWPVVITFFGWLAIAAGIARMTMPNPLKKDCDRDDRQQIVFFRFQRRNDLAGSVSLLSGIYCLAESVCDWLDTARDVRFRVSLVWRGSTALKAVILE